ncbi:uncharacterized protein PFL1_06156 [Pseudozyma flocculosa PF-1]|uniref:nitric oxide dioxygenase n=2 Tax=Pseudozyma flocculosa TaxID=84751 RepID=A0A5C3F8Y1_9BASI|nr:uncharacterized protein PFL1_06156 [Pseudozyma flocculosa PF-1]EPQ26221.1 hypothetical protein PFL1_06156 [Pseudozyma flocculosa PF-1]SPO40177.1 related to bacterial hemoglobin [Pseudozyma flocculosa]
MSLTSQQVAIIQATVPVLKQHGEHITTTFYRHLLEENPALKNVFGMTNMLTGRQPKALAHGLLAYASHITEPAVLADFVEKVSHKHASLGVEPAQYAVVGKYLLAAMAEVLGGDAFTPDVHDAWAAAYWILANIMIEREAQIYGEDPAWTGFRPLVVVSKQQESDEITSFYLEAPPSSDGAQAQPQPLPSFKPGQYVSVRLRVPGTEFLQPRQYSLSQAPNGRQYRISVKREPRVADLPEPAFISNLMHDRVHEGDRIDVSHPRGAFFFDPERAEQRGAPVVLISAGVGITPMMSILGVLAEEQGEGEGEGAARPVHMIHGARSSKVLAFDDDVRRICRDRSSVRRTLFLKNPVAGAVRGVDYDFASRVKLDELDGAKDLFLDDERALYFVCGPDTFMDDVARFLEGQGVAASRVRQEKFGV